MLLVALAVLAGPVGASAQTPQAENPPAENPPASDGSAPSLAWADPAERDDVVAEVPVVDPPPLATPDDGGADPAAPVPPVLAAAPDGLPRSFALDPVGSSRAVSAPSSDPMSLMERDGGLSVKLSDGHQLWMFADSALVIGSAWDYFSGRGTGAISVGSDPYTLTEPSIPVGSYRHPASQLIVGDNFTCPVGYTRYVWPSSAVAIPTGRGGDIVYIYYQSMCGQGGTGGDYFNVAMGLARYDYDPAQPPSVANPIRATAINSTLFPPMPGHNGPGGAGYGVTSMLDGGMVYAYACHYSPVWQSCRVARVPSASIAYAPAYRFWNGSDWVASMASAVDMDMPNSLIGVKGSVTYVPALGLYALADNDFPSPSVAIRWASRPQGPWTVPSMVSLPGCSGAECWAAEVHGSLSSTTSLAVTYYDSESRPGMRAISIPIVHEPVGAFEMHASGAPNRMVFWGWAVDPDVVDPVTVQLFVDGAYVGSTLASVDRPDIAARYPGQVGGGIVAGVDVTPGRHSLCGTALNRGAGASSRSIGCRTFDVAPPAFAPVLATNDDGRLEVFVSDALGAMVHAWQVTPGGVWSGWEPVGLEPRSAPAVARNGDGRLEIFAVDRNGWLVHRWQVIGSGWSPWQGMGVQATGTPAVGTDVDGRLELFVARGDRLLHAWQSPPSGWSDFVDSGASSSAPPRIDASADGRLEVFVTSGDGGLLHKWQTSVNGPFSAWVYTGIIARDAPDVQRSADGRLELFAIDRSQGRLMHQWQVVPNGPWSGWAPLGIDTSWAPVAAKNADNRLETFVLASDFTIWHAWQDPRSVTGWSGWESMGLAAWTQPDAAPNRDGRLEIVALTGSGVLRQATQVPGVGWSPWRPITPGLP